MNTENLLPLPPSFDVETTRVLRALIRATRALGELKGEAKKIPNSQILIDTLTLQEAKDSNEIENIVTTNDELFQSAVDKEPHSIEAKEVQNYAYALKLGYQAIKKREILTINDIKEIQSIISPNHPIRKTPGTVLKNPTTDKVIYTPPQNYDTINNLLSNLEKYINTPELHPVDSLIKMPIIHYQFESIHPFYDGNGRTGRIINMLYLVKQGLLDIPVLYLSSYIIKNKNDYYRLLQEVRTEENWEDWIVWTLEGVEQIARETIRVVDEIKSLMDNYKMIIKDNYNFYSHDLINTLFKHPYTKIEVLEIELNIHRNTASTYLNDLAKGDILTKVKLGNSNYYINVSLLNILKSKQ